MFVINLLVSIFSCFMFFGLAEEYENDERMYLLESPDQHEHTPRLEDFFWTGSGDGPPPPESPVPFPSLPSSPVVHTTTVVVNVYWDTFSPQAVTDKTTGECVRNCGELVTPGSLEPEIPNDQRYWLLTVIQGSTPDSLQLKLARLYQKAFLRQQERHLGIIKSLDAPPTRKKHEVHSFVVNKDENNQIAASNTPLRYLDSSMIAPSMTEIVKPTRVIDYSKIDIPFEKENLTLKDDIKATRLADVESWVLVPPTVIVKKREVTDQEEDESEKGELIDIPLEEDNSNETILFKREIIKPEQQPPVQVHIQNINESTETGSVEIVYVVLVGGRAVPAAVAARDMRLVRDAEVARELGAVVTTKAEPAYLKTNEENNENNEAMGGIHGTELWALAVGATIAVLLLLVLFVLLCLAQRRKAIKSAASLRAYRNEMMREMERNQLKQVHEEKDGRLISVVSPSRTRPSSTLLPIYRAASASSSSTTSSGVSEDITVRRRQKKKPHALRMPQKKRVGTTDSLLEAAGLDSSDSGQPSAPQTPTSFLSMPSVNSFPRGNVVEPLSRILEPVSVRHLDIDSPVISPKSRAEDAIPRRQMASQLVRLGSIDKDPGVIGPLVWDLHCQRIKDVSKPPSPAKSATPRKDGSRMRQRFNELMDDAFTLFGSAGSSPNSQETYVVEKKKEGEIAQARNDNVRLPGSPYTALDTVRGRSAGAGRGSTSASIEHDTRPRTSIARGSRPAMVTPARAWGPTPPHSLTRLPPAPTVNPALIMAQPRLAADDPALPLISAIKTEIQRVREQHKPNT